MAVSIQIFTSHRNRRAVHGILRPLLELAVVATEQYRDLIAPRTGQHNIEPVIVVEIIQRQGPRLLAHPDLHLVSKGAIAVAIED